MSEVRIVVNWVNVSENKNTVVTGDLKAKQEGRKGNSRVMMLFESGNHVDVNASFYNAPSDVVRPIDAYVVTECGGDCVQAARYAVEAVYSIYQQVYPRKISARQVVAFDLAGRMASPITGNSGGLAFAVSAAKHIFSCDPGPVAATGHVISSHGGGPVGGIKGVEAKIRRAIQELPSGGVVLYPKENENELSGDLRKEVAGAGLQLYSVSSVQEMLEKLFSVKVDKGHKNGFKMSMLWLLLGLSLAIGGIFAYVKWKDDRSTPAPHIAEVAETPAAPSEKEISSSTDSSAVTTANTVPETETNPAPVEAESTVPEIKKKTDLVETENQQSAEEDEEQTNPQERITSERKEAAVQQQFLDKGFD